MNTPRCGSGRLFASTLILAFSCLVGTQSQAGSWHSTELGKTTALQNTILSAGGYKNLQCPQGEYFVGMEIRSGMLIDAMQAECASLGPNGEHGELHRTQAAGNLGGGNPRTLRCPSGQVITAFKARAGEFIDQVSFACRSWKASQGVYGTLRWQPAQGGSGGEPAGPIECPPGMAVDNINALKTASYISRFRLRCRTLVAESSGGTMSAQSALNPQGRPGNTSAPSAARHASPVRKAGTTLPKPIAPIVKSLRSKTSPRGDAEITIDGERFFRTEGGRRLNNVTRVEIAGRAVQYQVLSPTQIQATIPKNLFRTLDRRAVPVVVTSGGHRITTQLPLR